MWDCLIVFSELWPSLMWLCAQTEVGRLCRALFCKVLAPHLSLDRFALHFTLEPFASFLTKYIESEVCLWLCGTGRLYLESCGFYWCVCMPNQKWVGCAEHWFCKCLLHIYLWFVLHRIKHKMWSSEVCLWLCDTYWLYAKSCGFNLCDCVPKQKLVGFAKLWFAKCLLQICL